MSKKIERYFEEFLYLRAIKKLEDGTIIAEGDVANFLTEGSLLNVVYVEKNKDGKKIRTTFWKSKS